MVETMKNIRKIAAMTIASLTVFAVPVLAYEKEGFSFNTGKSSYASWQAEHAEEYAAAEDEDKTGYIFNTAVAEAAARTNSYAQLPEDPTDEELAAFYDEYGYGSPAYVSDEEWNEDATSSYSYTAGRQAYTSRHQTWE